MRLIVGLGNPGSRYDRTRHNLGFMVIDELAGRHAVDMGREKFRAWFGLGKIGNRSVALAKPTTFMNRSGQAVLNIGRFYKLELEDLLIITDDLALPLGKLRIRSRGSAGGHNGLLDIAEKLGTDDFTRLRIGIDAPSYDATAHVLGEFGEGEWPVARAAAQRAADAAECWIEFGVDTAMNRYNPDVDSP